MDDSDFVLLFNPEAKLSKPMYLLERETIRRVNKELDLVAQNYGFHARLLRPLTKSVGVGGDYRTYGYVAEVIGKYDAEKLAMLSTEITNSIRGINRLSTGLNLLAGVNSFCMGR